MLHAGSTVVLVLDLVAFTLTLYLCGASEPLAVMTNVVAPCTWAVAFGSVGQYVHLECGGVTAAPLTLSAGCTVRVRAGVEHPVSGWGGVLKTSTGTLVSTRIIEDEERCVVDFDMQPGWQCRSDEIERIPGAAGVRLGSRVRVSRTYLSNL